jgi:hypothetical protein
MALDDAASYYLALPRMNYVLGVRSRWASLRRGDNNICYMPWFGLTCDEKGRCLPTWLQQIADCIIEASIEHPAALRVTGYSYRVWKESLLFNKDADALKFQLLATRPHPPPRSYYLFTFSNFKYSNSFMALSFQSIPSLLLSSPWHSSTCSQIPLLPSLLWQ